MLSNQDYVIHSLEHNLFFLRIAKEHLIFAAASLPPKDLMISTQAVMLKGSFEKLLSQTVAVSDGILRQDPVVSGEFVTDLTLRAEEETQALTGIPINMNITRREMELKVGAPREVAVLTEQVSAINQKAIALLTEAINMQTRLINSVLSCKLFSFIYPLMLDHVTREAKFALTMLKMLEAREPMNTIKDMIEHELVWNDIMGEHAEFIRGYLDPSEKQLFETANTFAKEFEGLEARTEQLRRQPALLPQITRESLSMVTNLRNFKRQGEEGIINCKIKSIIPPLLSDHVTREANHYLRLLNEYNSMQK